MQVKGEKRPAETEAKKEEEGEGVSEKTVVNERENGIGEILGYVPPPIQKVKLDDSSILRNDGLVNNISSNSGPYQQLQLNGLSSFASQMQNQLQQQQPPPVMSYQQPSLPTF